MPKLYVCYDCGNILNPENEKVIEITLKKQNSPIIHVCEKCFNEHKNKRQKHNKPLFNR